ncbi:unnamed protein product [Mycena citricolor]|uniref:Dopey N-terminal domain-containing protein n=1 Tax=Mycena citricolor TaxID=2018698 RepID=A0AAD2GWR3_9AGAR|nr:unnamed protein product [Mycena citricolor]
MKSFILALLPGLEEETGEFFEKVMSLLDRLSGTVSPAFFFQNIWLVMLTTPAARGNALNLLSRRLPRLNAEEAHHWAGHWSDDPGLLCGIRGRQLASQADDRGILMRAATSVVLRRDLSLNRRLYTWLLGPDERSEVQMEYLRQHGLELLRRTLDDEMLSPSGEYADSRPFKIFISLLDKWEIGAPLTESLVFDAFKAVKRLVEEPGNSGEDVTMTASTLYEAVEPAVLWKQLLRRVFDEINSEDGSKTEAIRMVLTDGSARCATHQGCGQEFDSGCARNGHSAGGDSTANSHTTLMAPVEGEGARPHSFAASFYGFSVPEATTSTNSAMPAPFASSFENLITLSRMCSRYLVDGNPSNPALLREVASQVMLLLERLVSRLESPLTAEWEPSEWLAAVLATLDHPQCNFTLVDRSISLIVVLQQHSPQLVVDERRTMGVMVKRLLKYLRPDLTVYHVRAVALIWALQGITHRKSHVESVLAEKLTARQPLEAFEAFGVLWRLTEDSFLPGFRFKMPMMIVLDSLKSEDVSLRRVGETWMRCSLRSYLRVLDPILFDLLDPAIQRTAYTHRVKGKEIQGYMYERSFDQHYAGHLLDLLLAIVRFGGQGFSKTARGSLIKGELLLSRVDGQSSYLDALVDVLLRFLQSEPKENHETSMLANNLAIQSTTVDLLQAIVARGEVDPVTVEVIQAVVVGKLYLCIHSGKLDLQNKLLHLLHSLISASAAEKPGNAESSSSASDTDATPHTVANTLLIQALVDGLSTPENRPVLQHWLDFVLMAVQLFQPALQNVVTPLNETLCKQILANLGDLLTVTFADGLFGDDLKSTATDAELGMLLGGLERLVLLSLAFPTESGGAGSAGGGVEDDTVENSSGLLGYVSTVFSSDTAPPVSDEQQLTARSAGYRSLHEAVRVLYLVWSTLAWEERSTWSSKDETLELIYSRTRLRCRRVLEHLFRVQSAEVFESIIDYWNRELPESQLPYEQAFELVDVLISSAQGVVHMVCESITIRMTGVSEKTKKQAINPDLTDAVLFKFLEQYLARLEGPIALQVWPRYLQLVKDVSGSTREYKPQTYPALRCLTVLAEKITQTTAMEDRRNRKELQETFGRLLDSCVMFIGRDQGSWIRRSVKENGRDSPAPDKDKEKEKEKEKEKAMVPTTASEEVFVQINGFIAGTAMPNLRRFLMDNDKVVAACTNVVYYIVGPAMKGKNTRPLDIDPVIVSIIREMTRIPAALKTWKPAVAELLNDNRLFNCTPDSAEKWKPIVKTLFDQDKTAFPELLTKVATAPSANIFTNREYEMLLRSLNIRRLSFVLLTGDKNFFLTQLPSIQEKLVDIFRNVTAPIVQSEVYLCIRVLLIRLSRHNLTSFWPVLLTEMYRVFEQLMTNLPSDGSEDLQLVLAASKCLDLLITLQSEEFQIHQWIFITDTVDAIYRPDGCFPEAMMDHLAEIVSSLPADTSSTFPVTPATPHAAMTTAAARPMRRPLLNGVRQLESMRDLVPFLTGVSIASYESVYASAGSVDWASVEAGILEDVFDGR